MQKANSPKEMVKIVSYAYFLCRPCHKQNKFIEILYAIDLLLALIFYAGYDL